MKIVHLNQNWHPDLIPIERIEEYHTHFLGKMEDGRLFFGYQPFETKRDESDSDRAFVRLEYAVVYIFDSDGTHVDTLHKFAGKAHEIPLNQGAKLLDELIRSLGKVKYCNIAVKPLKQ